LDSPGSNTPSDKSDPNVSGIDTSVGLVGEQPSEEQAAQGPLSGFGDPGDYDGPLAVDSGGDPELEEDQPPPVPPLPPDWEPPSDPPVPDPYTYQEPPPLPPDSITENITDEELVNSLDQENKPDPTLTNPDVDPDPTVPDPEFFEGGGDPLLDEEQPPPVPPLPPDWEPPPDPPMPDDPFWPDDDPPVPPLPPDYEPPPDPPFPDGDTDYPPDYVFDPPPPDPPTPPPPDDDPPPSDPPPADPELNYQTMLDSLNQAFDDQFTDDYYSGLTSAYQTEFGDDLQSQYDAALRGIYEGFKAQGRITEDELAKEKDPLDAMMGTEEARLNTLAGGYLTKQKDAVKARKKKLSDALMGLTTQEDIDAFSFDLFGDDDYGTLEETPGFGDTPDFFTNFNQVDDDMTRTALEGFRPERTERQYTGTGEGPSTRLSRAVSGRGSSRII